MLLKYCEAENRKSLTFIAIAQITLIHIYLFIATLSRP